jgi:hypothetical protein
MARLSSMNFAVSSMSGFTVASMARFAATASSTSGFTVASTVRRALAKSAPITTFESRLPPAPAQSNPRHVPQIHSNRTFAHHTSTHHSTPPASHSAPQHHSTPQHATARHGTPQHATAARHSTTAQHSTTQQNRQEWAVQRKAVIPDTEHRSSIIARGTHPDGTQPNQAHASKRDGQPRELRYSPAQHNDKWTRRRTGDEFVESFWMHAARAFRVFPIRRIERRCFARIGRCALRTLKAVHLEANKNEAIAAHMAERVKVRIRWFSGEAKRCVQAMSAHKE